MHPVNLASGFASLKHYYTYPVTCWLAEGVNNVIKALKRRSFGFRNRDYFRLKIIQVCGYLNSRNSNVRGTRTLNRGSRADPARAHATRVWIYSMQKLTT